MDEPILLQGRWWTEAELAAIAELVATHPHWSRWRLSIALAEQFAWRTARGELRDMAARHLLHKLAARGRLVLPARRAQGGRQVLRVLREEAARAQPAQQELWAEEPAAPVVAEALAALQPLGFEVVEAGQPAAAQFVRLLARHHYLGYGGETGRTLRYLVRDGRGREVACVLFGAAAWQVRAREVFLGWSAAQRRAHLGLLVNNTRFLLLPHVRVPHLASHVLGRVLRRLPRDWQARHGFRPVLAETFVERGRFSGACYRAANWQCVGQSCGRSRGDRTHRLQVPIKDLYLYPLCADFRARLGAPAPAPWVSAEGGGDV